MLVEISFKGTRNKNILTTALYRSHIKIKKVLTQYQKNIYKIWLLTKVTYFVIIGDININISNSKNQVIGYLSNLDEK